MRVKEHVMIKIQETEMDIEMRWKITYAKMRIEMKIERSVA